MPVIGLQIVSLIDHYFISFIHMFQTKISKKYQRKIGEGKAPKKSTKFALKIHNRETADIRGEESVLVGRRTATGCMELNRYIDSTLDTEPGMCVEVQEGGYRLQYGQLQISGYLIEVN